MMSHVEPIGWWAKNKSWFLPVAIILGCIAVFIVVIAVVIYFVVGAVKQSEPYLQGLNYARSNPAVIDLIGVPMEPGFFVGGSMPTPNEQGMVDLAITLTGPKGKGVILIAGQNLGNEWHYKRLLFRDLSTTKVIELQP